MRAQPRFKQTDKTKYSVCMTCVTRTLKINLNCVIMNWDNDTWPTLFYLIEMVDKRYLICVVDMWVPPNILNRKWIIKRCVDDCRAPPINLTK